MDNYAEKQKLLEIQKMEQIIKQWQQQSYQIIKELQDCVPQAYLDYYEEFNECLDSQIKYIQQEKKLQNKEDIFWDVMKQNKIIQKHNINNNQKQCSDLLQNENQSQNQSNEQRDYQNSISKNNDTCQFEIQSENSADQQCLNGSINEETSKNFEQNDRYDQIIDHQSNHSGNGIDKEFNKKQNKQNLQQIEIESEKNTNEGENKKLSKFDQYLEEKKKKQERISRKHANYTTSEEEDIENIDSEPKLNYSNKNIEDKEIKKQNEQKQLKVTQKIQKKNTILRKIDYNGWSA